MKEQEKRKNFYQRQSVSHSLRHRPFNKPRKTIYGSVSCCCGDGGGAEYLCHLIGWHVTVKGTRHLNFIFSNSHLLFGRTHYWSRFRPWKKEKRFYQWRRKSNTKSGWNKKAAQCKRMKCASTHWINYALPSRGSTAQRSMAYSRYFSTAMSFISFWFYLSLVENMCFNMESQLYSESSLGSTCERINFVSGEHMSNESYTNRIWCRSICPLFPMKRYGNLCEAVYRQTKWGKGQIYVRPSSILICRLDRIKTAIDEPKVHNVWLFVLKLFASNDHSAVCCYGAQPHTHINTEQKVTTTNILCTPWLTAPVRLSE